MSLRLAAFAAVCVLLASQGALAGRNEYSENATPSRHYEKEGGDEYAHGPGKGYVDPPSSDYSAPWNKGWGHGGDNCPYDKDCPCVPNDWVYNRANCQGDQSGFDCADAGDLCDNTNLAPLAGCLGSCSSAAFCRGPYLGNPVPAVRAGLCVVSCCPSGFGPQAGGTLRIQAKSCNKCGASDALYLYEGTTAGAGWSNGNPVAGYQNVASIDATFVCGNQNRCFAVCENNGIIDTSSLKSTFCSVKYRPQLN